MKREKPGFIERTARIFNLQKYSIYDGPGIRSLVFFKGCPLRCKWCSNPEGLEKKVQIMFQSNICVHCGACAEVCPVQIHTMTQDQPPQHKVDRQIDCIGCMRCEEVCPAKALSVTGKDMSISQVMNFILQDEAFYMTSGGGVTLGGGEVTMQHEFAANLLMECRQAGIHTAIETCGYVKQENLLKVAEFVDLFLFDIKHIDSDRHHQLTGVRNELILENLQELIKRRHQVKVRMPLMHGLNDDADTIRRTVEFLYPFKDCRNFHGIDLLPYHKMGVNKYGQLDLDYTIEGDLSLSEADLARIEAQLSEFDFPVVIVKH